MKKWGIGTGAILAAVVILIAVYDVIAIMLGGKEASISSNLIVWSYEYPSVPFLIGFVIGYVGGHLFWRMKPNRNIK